MRHDPVIGWLARNAFPLGVAAAGFTLAVGLPTGDPDTYWHLASGRWMLEHREILRTDIFSSTVPGQAYSVGEWLGEVVLALVFGVGQWAGLAIFRALLVAIAAFFLARLSRRGGAPLVAALLVVTWALVVSKTRWTDRPAIFTFVLFPVALDLLYAARAGSRRALVAIPPLILLWANLHGGYAIGIALVLAFTVEAVIRRRPDARLFALVLVASIGLSFVDPETFGAGSAAAHALAPPRFISEEAPPNILEPAGLVFAAFVLAALGFALLEGGALLDLLLLVPLLWLGLSAASLVLHLCRDAIHRGGRGPPVRADPPAHAIAPRAARAGCRRARGDPLAGCAGERVRRAERPGRTRVPDRRRGGAAERQRHAAQRVRLGRLPHLPSARAQGVRRWPAVPVLSRGAGRLP
jgi:hypothetical protein